MLVLRFVPYILGTDRCLDVDEIGSYDAAGHVVLTGGEPMIHEACVRLLKKLDAAGYHTTVETNVTIYRDAPIDLASISPKFKSSTPLPNWIRKAKENGRTIMIKNGST